MLSLDSIQNGYLTRYLEDSLLFARTVVVKFKEAALLMNEGVVFTHGGDAVNPFDQTTWKYYLNLAGRYHPTDIPMSVVSIDTLQPIAFTVENLRVHTATAEAHAFGTRQYYALAAQYPEQELLINGILNPVDINTAIAAENGTILGYPSGLIESNEETLVPELEAYLKTQFFRWFNQQFAMSDNLYCAVFFTILSTFLFNKLLNLRLARCKTREAHSFHVRMYLASHSRLDRFLPYLTQKQALWLYRNIAYTERNPGKTQTFEKLIEKLFTERKIPIAEYTVRHLDAFDDAGYPKLLARMKYLDGNSSTQQTLSHDVDLIYQREMGSAIGNVVDFEAKKDDYLFSLATSDASVIQTKVLHSSMADYTDAVPEPFSDVALRQWCHMALNGLYDVAVSFKNPSTSATYTLMAKDAFFYLRYVLLRRDGLTLTQFPDYLNMQSRKTPKPTVADLMKVVDHQYSDLSVLAERILARQPVISPCYSVSSFYRLARQLTDEAFWHWCLIGSAHEVNQRGFIDNMLRVLYEDTRVKCDTGFDTVDAWLLHNNLPSEVGSYEEAGALAQAIFEAATGLKVDSAKALKNIQKAMVELMSLLSSYSVQFTREINDDRLLPLNWSDVRIGNIQASGEDERILDPGTRILDTAEEGSIDAAIGTTVETHLLSKPSEATYYNDLSLDTGITMVTDVVSEDYAEEPGQQGYLEITYPGQNVDLDEEHGVIGYTLFDALPEAVKLHLKNAF